MQVVDQFLEVEGVALGPVRKPGEQTVGGCHLRAVQLGQAGGDELAAARSVEPVQRHDRGVRERGGAERAGPVGQDNEHGKGRDGPGEDEQQVH